MVSKITLRTYIIAILCTLLAFETWLSFAHQYGTRDLLIPQRGDWYIGLAYNMLTGNGYSDCKPVPDHITCQQSWVSAYRFPGYPLYLAANFLLFGLSDDAITP